MMEQPSGLSTAPSSSVSSANMQMPCTGSEVFLGVTKHTTLATIAENLGAVPCPDPNQDNVG